MVQYITKGIVVKKEVLKRTLEIGTASSPVVSLGCVNPNNQTDIAKVLGGVCLIQLLNSCNRLSYLYFFSEFKRNFRGANTF